LFWQRYFFNYEALVKRNPQVPLRFMSQCPKNITITKSASKHSENIRNVLSCSNYPGKGAENFLVGLDVVFRNISVRVNILVINFFEKSEF
jgi:hypothetical protein